MPALIPIVSVIFMLNGTIGIAQSPLDNISACDQVAASMISKSLEQFPDATDFGWGCGFISTEGYAPKDFKPGSKPQSAPVAPPEPLAPKRSI